MAFSNNNFSGFSFTATLTSMSETGTLSLSGNWAGESGYPSPTNTVTTNAFLERVRTLPRAIGLYAGTGSATRMVGLGYVKAVTANSATMHPITGVDGTVGYFIDLHTRQVINRGIVNDAVGSGNVKMSIHPFDAENATGYTGSEFSVSGYSLVYDPAGRLTTTRAVIGSTANTNGDAGGLFHAEDIEIVLANGISAGGVTQLALGAGCLSLGRITSIQNDVTVATGRVSLNYQDDQTNNAFFGVVADRAGDTGNILACVNVSSAYTRATPVYLPYVLNHGGVADANQTPALRGCQFSVEDCAFDILQAGYGTYATIDGFDRSHFFSNTNVRIQSNLSIGFRWAGGSSSVTVTGHNPPFGNRALAFAGSDLAWTPAQAGEIGVPGSYTTFLGPLSLTRSNTNQGQTYNFVGLHSNQRTHQIGAGTGASTRAVQTNAVSRYFAGNLWASTGIYSRAAFRYINSTGVPQTTAQFQSGITDGTLANGSLDDDQFVLATTKQSPSSGRIDTRIQVEYVNLRTATALLETALDGVRVQDNAQRARVLGIEIGYHEYGKVPVIRRSFPQDVDAAPRWSNLVDEDQGEFATIWGRDLTAHSSSIDQLNDNPLTSLSYMEAEARYNNGNGSYTWIRANNAMSTDVVIQGASTTTWTVNELWDMIDYLRVTQEPTVSFGAVTGSTSLALTTSLWEQPLLRPFQEGNQNIMYFCGCNMTVPSGITINAGTGSNGIGIIDGAHNAGRISTSLNRGLEVGIPFIESDAIRNTSDSVITIRGNMGALEYRNLTLVVDQGDIPNMDPATVFGDNSILDFTSELTADTQVDIRRFTSLKRYPNPSDGARPTIVNNSAHQLTIQLTQEVFSNSGLYFQTSGSGDIRFVGPDTIVKIDPVHLRNPEQVKIYYRGIATNTFTSFERNPSESHQPVYFSTAGTASGTGTEANPYRIPEPASDSTGMTLIRTSSDNYTQIIDVPYTRYDTTEYTIPARQVRDSVPPSTLLSTGSTANIDFNGTVIAANTYSGNDSIYNGRIDLEIDGLNQLELADAVTNLILLAKTDPSEMYVTAVRLYAIANSMIPAAGSGLVTTFEDFLLNSDGSGLIVNPNIFLLRNVAVDPLVQQILPGVQAGTIDSDGNLQPVVHADALLQARQRIRLPVLNYGLTGQNVHAEVRFSPASSNDVQISTNMILARVEQETSTIDTMVGTINDNLNTVDAVVDRIETAVGTLPAPLTQAETQTVVNTVRDNLREHVTSETSAVETAVTSARNAIQRNIEEI